MPDTDFQKRVYRAVRKIPRGMVSTYGAIARAAGNPRAVRAVGNALNKNVSIDIPCHRVVRSDRYIGGYRDGTNRKFRILTKEGVLIRGGQVLPECIQKSGSV